MAAAGVIAIVVSAAFTLPRVLRPVEHDAVWAVPALVATEALAWGGIFGMLLAGGLRIGNPLTAKDRLRTTLDDATRSRGFQLGWVVNVAGAIGTSTVIVVIAAGSWPVNAWPLALLGVACSFAASGLPFYSRVWRRPVRSGAELDSPHD